MALPRLTGPVVPSLALEQEGTKPVSLEREWKLPCLTLVSYVAFVPLTVLCALHWSLAALMWAVGLLTAFLESVMVVERRLEPFTDPRLAAVSSCRLIARDLLQGVRVLSTTLLPIMLASFQGASFVVTATWLEPRVTNCTVSDLPVLAQAGYTSFACTDGYVAVDLQLGVPAWGASHAEDDERGDVVRKHRLEAAGSGTQEKFLDTDVGRIPTIGKSKGDRFGFAAPIFRSLAARQGGEAPVAWAVKAGSPVKRSVCDDNLGLPGTCGFFAPALRHNWRRFLLAPSWFGESWGFNITRFAESEMLEAVADVQQRYPSINLSGPDAPTMVVAEDVRQYFGTAYPSLWVLAALLTIGLIDRVIDTLDLPPPPQVQEGLQGYPSDYSKMVLQEEGYSAGPESRPGLLSEFLDFWNDSLNTRRIREITSEIDAAALGPLPSGRSSLASFVPSRAAHQGPPSSRGPAAPFAPPLSVRSTRSSLLTPGR